MGQIGGKPSKIKPRREFLCDAACFGAHGPTYGAGLMRLLSSVRELGLQIFITEMEVNDRAIVPDPRLRDAAVAAAYKQYLDMVLSDPAVHAVLTWGSLTGALGSTERIRVRMANPSALCRSTPATSRHLSSVQFETPLILARRTFDGTLSSETL